MYVPCSINKSDTNDSSTNNVQVNLVTVLSRYFSDKYEGGSSTS